MRKNRTDPELLDYLLSSGETASPSEIDACLGLRGLPRRRVSSRILTDTLGPFELSDKELKRARSLLDELDLLLPTGIPPSVYEPLRHIFARIVSGGIMKNEWRKLKGPSWISALLSLYIVSEVTGTRPWWLQAVYQAVHDWRSGDPSRLGQMIVNAVSQSMNVAISSMVRGIVERTARSDSLRIGDLTRYTPRSGEAPGHTLRALSYAIRESFEPSFRRLGLQRVLVLSSKRRSSVVLKGHLAEDMNLQDSGVVRGQIWLTPLDCRVASDVTVLGERRLSLRLSLLDRSSGVWRTAVDLKRRPPAPADESDWIVYEERRSRKMIELSESDTLVLGVGWAFPTDSTTRDAIMSKLGVSSFQGQTSSRRLHRSGAFTLQYLPAEELLGLGDEVIALLEGPKRELSKTRTKIEAGVPRCESSLSKEGHRLFLKLNVTQYTGQLVSTQLAREMPTIGVEVVSATVRNTTRSRFHSLIGALEHS